MPKLFGVFGDESEEEEVDCKISINKKYAEKYQKFKECQELDRLKEKYGDDGIPENESSSSESEDEDAEALTPQIQKDFLQTLSMIREKDPKIYKKDSIFFHTDESNDKKGEDGNVNSKSGKKKKERPLFLKDYERQRLLEKGEKAYLSDSDDETNINNKPKDLTYVEEQNQLKKSILTAAHSDDSDAEDDDDLLQIRNDISEDAKKELEKNDPKLDKLLPKQTLDRYWKSEDIDESEKFLRDYILNKQFMDESAISRLPTYDEVLCEAEDEDEDERADEFERKFNFRYEEPDTDFIKQYPRTINESVRRTDDRRKQQRKERQERKMKEKDKKKEELQRLKNLKRKEIMEKIEKLKEITGNERIGFLEEDMQDDFDVSKYDQLMEKVFDNEYYDDNNTMDEEKPVFSDEEGEDFNYDETYGEYEECYEGDEYTPHCEDDDFIMDADYVPKEKSKKEDKRGMRRRGMNKKFLEAVEREKPRFDPTRKGGQTFEEYFDEYYKLDFEDIVDDIPVRFKYREVVPNDYGLTGDEILKAEDKELNEWCSLRKMSQYLGDEEERKLQRKFKKKSRDNNKKHQVFTSLKEEADKQTDDANDANKEEISNPRKLKHLQQRKKKTVMVPSWNPQQRRSVLSAVNRTKMKQIRNRFKGGSSKGVNKLSLQRLAAYGLDEKK